MSGQIESTIVIVSVIIVNAILGTIQTLKAEKSLDSLKKLSFLKRKLYVREHFKKLILQNYQLSICPN